MCFGKCSKSQNIYTDTGANTLLQLFRKNKLNQNDHSFLFFIYYFFRLATHSIAMVVLLQSEITHFNYIITGMLRDTVCMFSHDALLIFFTYLIVVGGFTIFDT